MKKISLRLLPLLLCLLLIAGCTVKNTSVAAPTPLPETIDDVVLEAGTLGALALALSDALGIPVSAGADATKPAVGFGAARMAVNALGLDMELRMSNMSREPSDADYLKLALAYEIAPGELFTAEQMTLEEMNAFVEAVAKAQAKGIGFFSTAFEGTPTELDAKAEMVTRMAVIAYNPLAKGRGEFHYGAGDAQTISYWTLAALGGLKLEDDTPANLLDAVATSDRTNPKLGTTTIEKAQYQEIMLQTFGISLPATVPGLTEEKGRIYLGNPTDDPVRQYPTAYRAEKSGDFVRVYVDVVNNTLPAQYAGKAMVTLRVCPEARLGWQVASIQVNPSPKPAFTKVDAPSTAGGYEAISLIDGNPSTVWQIGKADAETAMMTLTMSKESTITGLAIYNGDHSMDLKNLNAHGKLGVVGIRFSSAATKDDLRIDLAPLQSQVTGIGRELVIPFGKEITTDTVVLVFYQQKDAYVRISDIRPF